MGKLGVGYCMLATAIVIVAGGCSDEGDGNGTGGSSSGTGGNGTSSGTGGGGATGTGGDNPVPHQACVDLINGHRDSVGKPAYQRWTAAEACSDEQAADDAASGTPNSTFGACGEANSTGCPGWAGPAETMLPTCLQMMWDGGPGDASHDMLASDTYTTVACGFHTETNGNVWVMLNFM